MDELIRRRLMSEATPEEEKRLDELRVASPGNERRYHRLARVWKLLGTVESRPERAVPKASDLITRAGIHALPTAHDAPAVGARRKERGARFSKSELWVRITAISTMATAAVAMLIVTLPREDASFGAAEFVISPHKVTTLRLDDGTVVRLAAGSRLEFENQSHRVREVSFQGAGYFAVAKDPERPFIIRTAGGQATVLGTRFELRAEHEEVRVVVVEGRVALEAAGEREDIGANQMGYAGVNQPPTVVDVEDVEALLEWVDGLFVFQASPLPKAIEELEAHYGVEIVIEDVELHGRTVTAWLREQSFDSALTAVCRAVGAECTIRRQGATLRLPEDQ